MSIPVTASSETFTPACMAEIEGAPTFTFRHATVLDKHRYPNLVLRAGLRVHTKEALREAMIDALRLDFESDGMEQNITRLTAFWAAGDEHSSALKEHDKIVVALKEQHEGDGEPDLPPEPVLDFPADEAAALRRIIEKICKQSPTVCDMLADNQWHGAMMPRLLLRMFLIGTSLPVKVKKADDVLTPETVEAVYGALAAAATDLGVDPELAIGQLELQAFMSYRLTGDEEKNSSSPRSGSSSPKLSASNPSSGLPEIPEESSSNDPATSEPDNGSSSSASGSPASE
jgi:hypothetical protein